MMKSPGVAICSYGNIQEDFSRFFLYTELGRSKLNFAILYVVQTFRHHLYRGDVFFKVIFHDLFVYTWFKRSDFSFLYIQFRDKMNAGVACIFYSELIVVISVKFFLTNVN